jgi:[NiFe] hydrogenase assembly HybE family chaperone
MTTEGVRLADPTASLELAFSAVAQRMQGLGFVNPALRVQAVGFAPWDGHWLGVMVTPWSINLLLLPCEPAAWRPIRQGEKQRYEFPAGSYEFIDAVDPVVGDYRMCSLLSPALELQDHETAVLLAQFAREALFDPANAAQPEIPRPASDDEPGPLALIEAKAAEPMSKRDFLRGRILRAEPDVPRR